ncbi:copper amine oxidase N-terminal domain-containing protein [Fodinisporobacter ferrooxydans]|uniref:Copper amine oxidase N-terminal domain-containing protein n=1 Tax=Fodinisporobacter ferrooxydans TaxID=2901836 RepID=A0ABY4CWE1_9BACL|nr:copper amine oxidase N-terminal domain-containing protein [Alicyclobacillaceae bacterium MYW30-H2]
MAVSSILWKLCRFLGTSAILAGGISFGSVSDVHATTLTATTSPAVFQFNNSYIYPDHEYAPINYNGHVYVSVRFVAENMGVDTTWNSDTHTVAFTTGTGQTGAPTPYIQISASKIKVDPQQINFVFNGQPVTLDSSYVAINYNGHIYVPARFVAEHLGAVVGWDGTTNTVTINWINGPYHGLLPWFAQAYPNEAIGAADIVQFENGKSYLVVQTKPDWMKNKPGTIYFISPNHTIVKFSSNIDFPTSASAIPLSSGTLIEIGGIVGAHSEYNYLFDLQNSQPEVFTKFFADNGLLTWIQDGKLDVFISNRTYAWDLVAADGQKDDSSKNVVEEYNPNTKEFNTIDSYTSSVFTPTDMNSNPRVDAVESIYYLRSISVNPNVASGLTYIPFTWSTSAITDYNNLKQSLSFLQSDDTQVVTLKTINESGTKANYLYQANGHSLLISLQKDTTWHVKDFAVDPSAQALQR